MSPTIDDDGVPDTCLSIRLSSDWGHFKQVGRTATKQTYRIVPRTTVAGLLAAIVGAPRDSYYDVFTDDGAAIAITPLGELRTINVPTIAVGTDPDQSVSKMAGNRQSKALTYQDTRQDRQIHVYETLVDPEYRIDVALEDESFYDDLRRMLERGESHYPPSMGLSEYLADVELLDANAQPVREASSGPVDVDSAAPASIADTIPQPGVQYSTERSPAVMESISGGRRTTRFDDYVYAPSAEHSVRLSPDAVDGTPATVGGKTVLFR